MIVVVDASVAAKWLLPEPLSETAARLLQAPHDLVAPELVRLEVASALLKAIRRGVLDPADAAIALAGLQPPALRLVAVAAYAIAALDIAARHGGSVYDGAYVALGAALDAVTATADAELARTARAAGVRAWLLSEPPPPEIAA